MLLQAPGKKPRGSAWAVYVSYCGSQHRDSPHFEALKPNSRDNLAGPLITSHPQEQPWWREKYTEAQEMVPGDRRETQQGGAGSGQFFPKAKLDR